MSPVTPGSSPLECTPVDIAMSVVEQGGAVYSPAVLRPGGQVLEVELRSGLRGGHRPLPAAVGPGPPMDLRLSRPSGYRAVPNQ